MRKHKALDLATELVRAADPQIRRNATTALAAIGTADSISELVAVALRDRDEDVRRRAEDELVFAAQRDGAGLNLVADAIYARIASEDEQEASYSLLGSLRSRGLPIRPPRLGIRARFRLAARMRSIGAERFPYFRPMLLGTLVASACLVIFALLVEPHLDVPTLLLTVVFGCCLFPQLALLVAGPVWRWRPIPLETDRLGAALVDLRLAIIGGFIVGLLLLLVAGLAASFTPNLVYGPILISIVMIAAVRTGCVLAYGAFRGGGTDYAFETAAGTAFGIGAIVLTVYALRGSTDSLTAAAAVLLWPIAAGIAVAVAGVDHQVPVRKRLLGRWAGILAGAVIAVAAICGVSAGTTARVSGLPPGGQIGAGGAKVTIEVPSQRLPWTGTITPPSLPSSPPTFYGLHAEVKGPAGVSFAMRSGGTFPPYTYAATSPATIDVRLAAAGALVIDRSVSSVRQAQIGDLLPEIAKRLAGRLRPAQETADFTLEIVITPIQSAPQDASNQNRLCWDGTLSFLAARPEIKSACDQAVELTKEGNAEYLDSRGINHLASSQFPAAAIDFGHFLSDQKQLPANIAARKVFIHALDAGINRFTLPIGDESAVNLNNLCWRGSLNGFAARAEIKKACDQAVGISKNDPHNCDSRGLNRAMNGDLQGAIEDFQAYVSAHLDTDGTRQEWIAGLTKGSNPFTTPAVLQALH